MNIELRFLQKAIEDKNYISFSYGKNKIQKVKPLKLLLIDGLYTLHLEDKTFNYSKISKLQILKERF
ncbi:hypothetical protein OAR97_01530 [Arcobacteraceae bacterium]|nr:hypothetical protein [Arcobacteraceae bacterium]